jgi:hypothetical protein
MKPIRNVLLAALTITIACFAIVYTSCKKDHCNNVVCQNGGACDGGNCTCPAGFEGTRCETLSRDKFIFVFNGSDTCSNDDTYTRQYTNPIQFLAILANPVEMSMKNFLNNINDSAVCTMQSVDSFTFIGSNNSTTYTGFGTLRADTLKMIYHVQQDTISYNCEYVGGLRL